ncbi:hypothetical protein COW46_04850 [Candidatus Gracilibacteria bacterium CG17_big_fil_post_rev_8_21_14_2_50_48_13]|nr:MAG: hypothetical protein COW46_04850 [Candidatus Gracilibacteria bacterium CG17_big_fil_post_rev_8_21_14_2_50_48_13]
MRYFFGILAIAVAVLLLRYNEQAYRIFGRWNWAEKMFTSGGTRSGIKLVAIVAIILSIVFMTDTVNQFRDLLLAPFKAAAPIVR